MILYFDVNDLLFSASDEPLDNDTYNSAKCVASSDLSKCDSSFIGLHRSSFTITSIIKDEGGFYSILGLVKTKRTEKINLACRSEIIAGFESSALGTAHHYPFDPEDQSNLMSTFLLAEKLNVSKVFKCWDSAGVVGYRLHTVAQLTQVGQDAETHKMAALMKAATLKAQIDAATTAAEVEAIVW